MEIRRTDSNTQFGLSVRVWLPGKQRYTVPRFLWKYSDRFCSDARVRKAERLLQYSDKYSDELVFSLVPNQYGRLQAEMYPKDDNIPVKIIKENVFAALFNLNPNRFIEKMIRRAKEAERFELLQSIVN